MKKRKAEVGRDGTWQEADGVNKVQGANLSQGIPGDRTGSTFAFLWLVLKQEQQQTYGVCAMD